MARRKKWSPRSTMIPKSSATAGGLGECTRGALPLQPAPPSEGLLKALRATRFGHRSKRDLKAL